MIAKALSVFCVLLSEVEDKRKVTIKSFDFAQDDMAKSTLEFGIFLLEFLFKNHLPFILNSNNICAVSESESAEKPAT